MNKKIFIISLTGIIFATILFVVFIYNKENNNVDVKNNKLADLKINIANDDQKIASYKTKIYNSKKLDIGNDGKCFSKNVSEAEINFYKNIFIKATWKEIKYTYDTATYCYISFDDLDINVLDDNNNTLIVHIEKHYYLINDIEDTLPSDIKSD